MTKLKDFIRKIHKKLIASKEVLHRFVLKYTELNKKKLTMKIRSKWRFTNLYTNTSILKHWCKDPSFTINQQKTYPHMNFLITYINFGKFNTTIRKTENIFTKQFATKVNPTPRIFQFAHNKGYWNGHLIFFTRRQPILIS